MSVRPEALLFDLGGVLVEVDWSRAFALWAARSGVPQAEIAARFRRDADYEAHECGALGDAEFFARLARRLGVQLGEADMLAGWNAILGAPFPGVPELLRRLAERWPVYVFSNTNVAHVTYFRPRYRQLFAAVREVLLSCELGARKPAPQAFLHAVERIGVPPERILFFDDLEENVAGARLAGMQARHVPSPASLPDLVAGL